MLKPHSFVALLLAIIFVSISVAFSQTTNRISGIYSNIYYNTEGGDLLGMELFIFPSGTDPQLEYLALIQIAEGGAPFAVLVPLIMKSKTIEFTLPSGKQYSKEHFTGKFVDGYLVIRWSNGTEEHLKRGKSYWQ
jgi:hypothetical protein